MKSSMKGNSGKPSLGTGSLVERAVFGILKIFGAIFMFLARRTLGKLVLMFIGACIAGPWGAVLFGIAAMLAPKRVPQVSKWIARHMEASKKKAADEAEARKSVPAAPRSPSRTPPPTLAPDVTTPAVEPEPERKAA